MKLPVATTKKITQPKAKSAPWLISTPLLLRGNEEGAQREDGRHPCANEDPVEFVVHGAIIGKEQPHTHDEAGCCREEDRGTEYLRWFHEHTLPEKRDPGKDGRTVNAPKGYIVQ